MFGHGVGIDPITFELKLAETLGIKDHSYYMNHKTRKN